MAQRFDIAKNIERILKTNDPNHFYGSAYDDQFMFHNPRSLPRFGHLARKALQHYAPDRYNPHEHGMTVEVFVREIIREMVSYKVLYKTKTYDWEWIDNSLRKAIGGCLGLDLAYDQRRIDAGFKGAAKAASHIDWSNVN